MDRTHTECWKGDTPSKNGQNTEYRWTEHTLSRDGQNKEGYYQKKKMDMMKKIKEEEENGRKLLPTLPTAFKMIPF